MCLRFPATSGCGLKKWEKSWNPDQFYSHPNFLSGQKVRLFYNDGVESGVLFMESLVLSLNVVLPLLFLILVGQGVRRLKLCDERALKQMNQLVFKLFLPCTLFNNILSTDLKTVLQPQLLIFAAGRVPAFPLCGGLCPGGVCCGLADHAADNIGSAQTGRDDHEYLPKQRRVVRHADCAADLWGFPVRRDVDVDRSDCSFV